MPQAVIPTRRAAPYKEINNGTKKTKHKLHLKEWIRVVRRLLVLASVICYIYASVTAASDAKLVLTGFVNRSMTFVPYVSTLIPDYVGTTTIRASPLVVQFLQNSTTSRDETMYLQSKTTTSFEGCEGSFNKRIYNNTYMRQNLQDLIADTSYNLTFLAESELILPVVDCTSGAIVFADDSAVRVFYLMRKKHNPNDLYLLTWSLSTQDYIVQDEHQFGATASMTLTFINDVRATSVSYYHVLRLGFPFQPEAYQPYTLLQRTTEGFWELESIVRPDKSGTCRRVRTACRTGFYVDSETQQANAKNLNWDLLQDPIDAMKIWSWAGITTVRDSWAWVHWLHVLFSFEAIFNLMVLVLVIYQNARNGKIWIGDAFVSISSTLAIRVVLILATWYLNGFWTLMEFCLKESNELADVQHIFGFPMLLHADLLTLYLGLAGFLGHMMRERIDPALAVLTFEVGFLHRRTIALWFPKTMAVASAFAKFDYLQGLSLMDPEFTLLTPMRLWTMHKLPSRNVAFICATLFPSFVSFVILILYVPARKIYRYYVPETKIMLSHGTGGSPGFSTETEALLAWKSSLTVFEIATGAPLQNRVGLVSDYDSCVYIKGLKFASADGIYCNGYVIANSKYLIATDDLLVILMMVLTRTRFKNVYVYEVNGHTVQQTARLVYPEMLSLRELLRLYTSLLS